MNFTMATLGVKEMGKFPWEGREKSLSIWLSQFSKTKLGRPFEVKVLSRAYFQASTAPLEICE
jgi:hypothetical protein